MIPPTFSGWCVQTVLLPVSWQWTAGFAVGTLVVSLFFPVYDLFRYMFSTQRGYGWRNEAVLVWVVWRDVLTLVLIFAGIYGFLLVPVVTAICWLVWLLAGWETGELTPLFLLLAAWVVTVIALVVWYVYRDRYEKTRTTLTK
ncbi:MAG: hypothetical protein AAFU54_03855 [Chloroflexota bacterium]